MIIFETIICAETEIALNLSCTITTTNIRKPLVIEGVFYVQVLFHDQALDLVGEPLQDGDQLPKFKVFTTHDEKIKTKDLLGKPVLLSVMPDIDTRVCSIQTKKFNQQADKYPHVQFWKFVKWCWRIVSILWRSPRVGDLFCCFISCGV